MAHKNIYQFFFHHCYISGKDCLPYGKGFAKDKKLAEVL